MFDVIETLESYKIDLAEEGIKDKLSNAGSAIKSNKVVAAVMKWFRDRINGLKEKFSKLSNKLKSTKIGTKIQEKINDKAPIKYVEMSLKGVKLISGSIKAVSGRLKSGKNFADNAKDYEDKISNYITSMNELGEKVGKRTANNVYSPARLDKFAAAISSGIQTLSSLDSTIESTLTKAVQAKRSYNESNDSHNLTAYIGYIKKSITAGISFLSKSMVIITGGTKDPSRLLA